MRIIGILLIVAGLYFAVAKPWFSTNLTGEELATTKVYDRKKALGKNRGWEVGSVFLEKESSPAIIRLKVGRLPGQFYNNAKLKLLIRLAPVSRDGTTDGTIVNEAVTVDLDTGVSETSSGQELQLAVISTKEFVIPATGNYKIGAFPIAGNNVTQGSTSLKIDPNITQISAIVMSDVEVVASSSPLRGGVMIVAGILLMSIAKRRRKLRVKPQKDVSTTPVAKKPEPVATQIDIDKQPEREKEIAPPPKTDVGKTIQWGRDAGKKR